MNLILIALSAVLVNNIVLTRFLGICSFLGATKKSSSAIGMSLALAFVLIFSGVLSYSLYFYVLVPLGLGFLRLVAFILVIASLVQFVEMFIKRFVPSLYKSLGIYLPLITTNCVVLTVALDVAAVNGVVPSYDFVTMLVYVAASAVGYGVVTVLFSYIQERMAVNNVMPKAFQGPASALLVAGLMAIAFLGFKGMI
jgi:electron transport complex protein RnfA